MRVYLDSSALLKRVLAEAESDALVEALDLHAAAGTVLISSTLAWIEVGRAIRARFDSGFAEVADGIDDALSGVAEHRIDMEVVSLSRRIQPNVLRSLDAIHVASALLLDVDELITYDERMAQAALLNGLRCSAPGQAPGSV